MRVLFQLVLFSLCFCAFESAEDEDAEVFREILDELKKIKEKQVLMGNIIKNVSSEVDGKVKYFETRLQTVRKTVDDYQKRLENDTGYISQAFMPRKGKEPLPVCPTTSCFKKSTISKKTADSIEILSSSSEPLEYRECANSCLKNKSCAAFRHMENKKCVLLTDRHPHLEYEKRKSKAVIWRRKDTKLGKCPSHFEIKFESNARYRMINQIMYWKEADLLCKRLNSKLAELTSWREIEYLGGLPMIRPVPSWHVGGVKEPKAELPDHGWYWYHSKVTIPHEGFVWKNRKPANKRGDENTLGAEYFRKRIRFTDISPKVKLYGALCECIQF